MGFGKLHRLDATDPRELARQLDAKKRALERLLSHAGPQGDETAGRQALTDLVKDHTALRLAPPMFELVPTRARVLEALQDIDVARTQLAVGATHASSAQEREAARRAATSKARRSVAELFVPRQDASGGGLDGSDETRPVRDPTIELADFIAPERGSHSLSAVIIGNAEGTRTPGGGLKGAYGHHNDPGNAKPNRGSYSLQNATHLSPEEADREQQRRMQAVLPAYVGACKAAGIDPRNVVALVTYWDLYNLKPALATKFGALMPELARRGCTFEAALDLRLRASQLLKGRSGWTGWENVASTRLQRKPAQITDDEFWRVVRMVHGERQSAMQASLGALRIAKGAPSKSPSEPMKAPSGPLRGSQRPTEPVLETKGLRLGAGLTGVIGGKPKPPPPSTNAWNGTDAVADLAKRIAASMGIIGTGKRAHTVNGTSSTESDHHTSQRGAYAVDFGVLAKFGPRAKEVGTELATKIAQAYGIPPPYVGTYKKHYLLWNGIHVRIQILWRVTGHYDHVHFGVRRVR